MQSPRIEWALGIGYLALVDALRDRGEPDGDTLTEVVREVFHTDTPEGRAALAAALGGGAILLFRHFTKPEMRSTPCPSTTPS